MADINRVTTLIVLGDARNNNTDPRLDLLAKSLKVSPANLATQESTQLEYGGFGDGWGHEERDVAAECSTLKQLERVIDTLLTELNS